jgi:hypothetical protein
MRASILLIAAVVPVLAQDTSLVRESEPLTPMEEAKRFRLPPGFSAQLVASEPVVNKPMNLAFDEKGRLWCTSSAEYPWAVKKEQWATPEGLLEIVKAVQSRAVGINLDTGNFHGADPYEELARCAPWAVNVQVKVEVRRAGAKAAEPADLKRVAGILRSSGYQGWVVLEYESKADPFVAVPEHLKALREALA